MKAITREEKIISGENLTPITRKEMFLAKAAGMDVATPEPITREEMFLSKISGSGGGSGGTGGVELNIAYGDTEPEDITKLWCKTSKAQKVTAKKELTWENGNRPETIKAATKAIGNAAYKAFVMVGSRVYILGGYANEKIMYYDLETRVTTTTSIAFPPSSACYDMGCCAVGTVVYCFGGGSDTYYNSANDLGISFDTETDTVTTLGVTYKGSGIRCVPIGSKIHMFGGRTGNSQSAYSNDHKVYDVETGEMTDAAKLPTTLYGYSCAVVGDTGNEKIYIFGGFVTGTATDSIVCYDTKTDNIYAMTSKLEKATADCAAVTVGDKIYVLGGATRIGSSSSKVAYADIYCYDLSGVDEDGNYKLEKLETALIAKGNMNTAILYNDAIIVFPKEYNMYPETFEWGIGKPTVNEGELQIIQQSDDNIFPFINTGTIVAEIGVKEAYKGNKANEGEKVEAALHKDGAWVTI